MKNVVYTVVSDNKYHLRENIVRSENCRYICFSNLDIKSKFWEIVKIKNEGLCNKKISRKVKILHHEYLKDFDFSVYIDSRFTINLDVNKFISDNMDKNDDMLSMKHNKRNCLYAEADFCISKNIGKKEEIEEQIKEYTRNGYPKNNGLNANGFLIRRNSEKVNNFMKIWWEEVRKYSERDQISFNYVLWKNPLNIVSLDFRKTFKTLDGLS